MITVKNLEAFSLHPITITSFMKILLSTKNCNTSISQISNSLATDINFSTVNNTEKIMSRQEYLIHTLPIQPQMILYAETDRFME